MRRKSRSKVGEKSGVKEEGTEGGRGASNKGKHEEQVRDGDGG